MPPDEDVLCNECVKNSEAPCCDKGVVCVVCEERVKIGEAP